MSPFPTGVVTLVFTDIEGSSALWETHGERFAPVLAEHNRLLRAAAARWGGVEVKTEGDAFFLAFARADAAILFAVDAQRAIAAHPWPDVLPGVAALRVRIGMHTGAPIVDRHPDGALDYFGPVVNRAARVGGAGYGGQIVVSDATLALAQSELPPEIAAENLGRHRLKGVGEETLWQIGHPALPARFPPLKTLSGAKHNLPDPATPFIGREDEIARWTAWLREDATRLVTLVGFAGHGKTRLALQIAERLVDEFADGVWWVALEEARDGEAMLARIAHELRIHLSPQPTLHEQVLQFHRDRQLLLVLDNLEQIPDAAGVVAAILSAGPRVKCLVTTRRALEIRWERRAEVSPLALSEAAHLFVERARSRRPDFESTAEIAPDIEELCRRLEGVPLAIELAASRITVLAPGEMLPRLHERFRLLQTRAPDLPPRQRALRGAIDWSYDLLHPEERALLAQLAVFAGGFDLRAAEAICADFDVLEGVAELRRHSLLGVDGGRERTRFTMLESVRAYALEKLAAQPDAPEHHGRHARYFLQLAQRCSARLRTRDEAKALDEFFAERANLRAALDWAQSDASLCADLALAAGEPLYRCGLWDEARAALQIGRDAAERLPGADATRAALDLRLASLAHDTGDPAAMALAEAALRGFEALHDAAGRADALNLLGLLATDGGDWQTAQTLFERSLGLRPEGDHHGRAIAQHNLARLAARGGRDDEAQRRYEEALRRRRAGGDARGEAETLGNLGALIFLRGDHAEARRLYRQSLELRRALRDRVGIALMLFNLAEVAEGEQDPARAVTLYVHAARIFHELGSPFARAADEALRNLAARLGDPFADLRRAAEGSAWEDRVE
jgi:predicted ATPase/class 3 adenylate cyclase